MATSQIKRDSSIDLMRFIGLTMIILAHIGLSRSTSLLFQLRSFDVPLMVFTSGLAFSGKSTGSYLSFILKRTLRLIVPVYLFVSAYLLLNPLLSSYGLVREYQAKHIIGTFMLRLNPSIGYVWVIRVFLIVMLVTPLLIRLNRSIRKDWKCFAVIAAFLAIQQVLVMWLKPVKDSIFIQDWLLYVFAYSAIFLFGLRVRDVRWTSMMPVLLLLAVGVGFCAFDAYSEYETLMRLQANKYPPGMYFILWGMFICAILWTTSRYWVQFLDNRLFDFIGRNTIWIYLWHIPFVNVVVKGPFDSWHPVWKYVFVYLAAVCIYAAQYRLVKLVDKRWPENRITRYFVG